MYAPSPRRSRKRPAAVFSCTGDTTSTNVSPNGITALLEPEVRDSRIGIRLAQGQGRTELLHRGVEIARR